MVFEYCPSTHFGHPFPPDLHLGFLARDFFSRTQQRIRSLMGDSFFMASRLVASAMVVKVVRNLRKSRAKRSHAKQMATHMQKWEIKTGHTIHEEIHVAPSHDET